MGGAAQVAHAAAKTHAEQADVAGKKESVPQPTNPLWQRMAIGPAGAMAASAAGASTPPSPPRAPVLQRKCKTCDDERDEDGESPPVQAKSIAPADDVYEREADAVAARVVQTTGPPAGGRAGATANVTPLPVAQRKPLAAPRLQRMCAECEEEEEESTEALNIVDAPGAGEPLSESLRGRIEPVLGADLAGVRVHSDARSQNAADTIGARAFTYGNDIFLGAGESGEDVGLMAHEATHVVQQGAAAPLGMADAHPAVGPVDRRPMARTAEPPRDSAAENAEAPGEHGVSAGEGSAEAPQDTGGAALGVESPAPESDTSAGPDSEGTPPLADETPEDIAPAEHSIARIQSAPDSNVKPFAVAEMENIQADCATTESALVDAMASARGSIEAHLADARANITGFVESTIASVTTFVAARRMEVVNLATSVLMQARSRVTTTIESGQAVVNDFTKTVESVVTGAIASIESGVAGIAEGIAGVLNRIPLPDVPGVATVREFIIGMISDAGTAVNTALGAVRKLIGSAVATAARLARAMLGMLSRALNAAIGAMARVVATVLRSMFQFFNGILGAIAAGVRGAVYGLIFPILRQIESAFVDQIARAVRVILRKVRKNRDRHLQALAESLGGSDNDSGSGGGGDDSASTTHETEWIESIRAIGRKAAAINRLVVATFVASVEALFTSVITMLVNAVAGLMSGIAAFVAEVIASITAAVANMIAAVEQALADAIAMVANLWQQLTAAITSVVQWVRGFVESPIDAVVGFGRDVLGGLLGAAADAVTRFVTGGALVARAPPTFTSSPPPAAPVIPPFVQPSPVEPVNPWQPVEPAKPWQPVDPRKPWPADPGRPRAPWRPVDPVKPRPIPIYWILVIVLILILLWWYEWAVERKRERQRERERERKRRGQCQITTQTIAHAPDGTGDDRKLVGVNEEVRMTNQAQVVWSATCGEIFPVSTYGMIWTAPITARTCKIIAKPIVPENKPCEVTMEVVAPTGRLLTDPSRDLWYDDDKAGSGFETKGTLPPLNVSFSRLETQQQAARGVATGYYDTELGWGNREYPASEWKPVGYEDNSVIDAVGTKSPGTEGTFDVGTFSWTIPQCYRAEGGVGRGIEFSVAEHTQNMTGKNAEETTAKEGKSRTRLPPKVVREDPLTAKTAEDFPALKSQFNKPQYDNGNVETLPLLNGHSDRVGTEMQVDYLTSAIGKGTPAGGQDNLYGYERLPLLGALRNRAGGNTPHNGHQVYIRGHLLNENVGGPGEAHNEYPITQTANSNHLSMVERDLKKWVKQGLVVFYRVTVTKTSGPDLIDVDLGAGKHCFYQHVDSRLDCTFHTYKLFNDGTTQANSTSPSPIPITSSFDEAGFAALVRTSGCTQKPP